MSDNVPFSKTFAEYETAAMETVQYPLAGKNMLYPATKLAGEAGEVADKIGKHWRNETARLLEATKHSFHHRNDTKLKMEQIATLTAMSAATLSPEKKKELAKELGDCLWYIAVMAKLELGMSLEEIANMNIEKLALRNRKGTILGEGDNR